MSDRLGSQAGVAYYSVAHAVLYGVRSYAARALWPLSGCPENHLDVGHMAMALADSLRDVGRE